MAGAGDLDQRVTIERPERAPDGGGGHTVTWEPVATVWAAVEPLSGRERLQAQQVQSAVTYRIRIRRRADITAGMRVVWCGQVTNIRACPDPGPRAAFMTLDCEAGVAI